MTFYRLLLLAFPRRFRRELGDDMARMFAAQLLETRSQGGSEWRLWLRAIADAAWHGSIERTLAIWCGLTTALAALAVTRRWRCWMAALRQDLRYAIRMLGRQPGTTAVAILTLALGIGGNAAIFSAVDSLLLRPLPYHDPDRLVMIWEKRHAEGVLDNTVAPADYVDWARMNTVFEAIAGQTGTTVDMTGDSEPVRLVAGAVSPAFFDLLGTRMAYGRNFQAGEDIVGRHQVVVLGHGLWQRRFGGDPGVVGRTINLNGLPRQVIGVLPETFEFPDRTIDLWIPLALTGGTQPPSRGNHFLSVYARLKPGASLQQARSEMDRVAAILSKDFPESNANHGAWVIPLRDQLVLPVKSTILLLLAAVGFVLLIACVNVANLLLARAGTRRAEVAIRAAIGAGRWRLASQALIESLVLGLAGGLAGLLVARWGIGLLRALVPEGLRVVGLQHLGLDWRLLAFTFALSLATSVAFGLLPAWHFASQPLESALKGGARTQGRTRRRIRQLLVVSEVALASLLLAGAGLTVRSFQTVLRADAGIHPGRVLTALVSLPPSRYAGDDRIVATFAELERRLREIPGVRSVGATSALPLTGQDARSGVAIEGFPSTAEAPTRAHVRSVTPDYFTTMGMQVIAGRTFTSADGARTPLVVVINETMSRRYWPNGSPLGKRLSLPGGEPREVIGIVRDVRHWGLDRPVNPEFYFPVPQMVFPGMTFVLASNSDSAALASHVRDVLRAVDPDLPLSGVRTMDEVVARSVAVRRAGMSVLGLFGIIAVVLAAAGIYGVMSHLVAQRTGEIGVRMTMGARPRDIVRMVLVEGLSQAAIGLAIGLAAAALVMRTFRSYLYEVSPTDPLTLALVAAALGLTAALACVIPARRAMLIDPVAAVRQA
jgi:putative ABC transport system permease protein